MNTPIFMLSFYNKFSIDFLRKNLGIVFDSFAEVDCSFEKFALFFSSRLKNLVYFLMFLINGLFLFLIIILFIFDSLLKYINRFRFPVSFSKILVHDIV